MSNSGAIDPKFFNEVSQFAHFFASSTVYLTIGRFSHRWAFYLLPVGILLAAWKEFWYDERYEDDETRGSSLEDFTFYCFGMAFAAVILWL